MHRKITHVSYACFTCRKTFKKPIDLEKKKRSCARCGGEEWCMGIAFRSPKNSDAVAWEIVELLVRAERWPLFEGNGKRSKIPKTLDQAKVAIANSEGFDESRRIADSKRNKKTSKILKIRNRRIDKKVKSSRTLQE